MRRTRDLAIFMMMTGRRQTKPIALPIAHAHGVIMHFYKNSSTNSIWQFSPSIMLMASIRELALGSSTHLYSVVVDIMFCVSKAPHSIAQLVLGLQAHGWIISPHSETEAVIHEILAVLGGVVVQRGV